MKMSPHPPPLQPCFPPYFILPTRPGPCSRGTGDLGLQGEQGVKQRPGLSDLAGNVSIEVLAKHLRVLCGWQHADIFSVGGLGTISGYVIRG